MIPRILLALLLMIGASPAPAFNLGGLLEEIAKKPADAPADAGPQGGQPGLAGLAGETPVEEEIAIGREIAGRLLGAVPLVKDRRLQQYVNRVGAWVARQSGRSGIDWYFGVIASDDINAFAAPGGYVLVTRGLYRTLRSEAELAGVLAHEIGHIVKRHHLKILQQGRLIEIGGRLLKQRMGSEKRDQMIKRLIGSGAEILARGLDKNAEYEADRIGVVLAARAGYDAYALPAVLQEIGHVSADDSRVSLLFKTHPHPEQRLLALGDAMEAHAGRFMEGKTVSGRFYRLAGKGGPAK